MLDESNRVRIPTAATTVTTHTSNMAEILANSFLLKFLDNVKKLTTNLPKYECKVVASQSPDPSDVGFHCMLYAGLQQVCATYVFTATLFIEGI